MKSKAFSKKTIFYGILSGAFVSVLPWLMVWINTHWLRVFPLTIVSGSLWLVNGLSIVLSEALQLSEKSAVTITFLQWIFLCTVLALFLRRNAKS